MELKNNGEVIREDKQLLVIAHLSQLLDYITGFGGFIVPLILWIVNKDKVIALDRHGKSILNFQISIFIYAILSIPLVLALGLGILTLLIVAALGFILPIVNAIRASNGQEPNYYISITFVK